MAKTLFLQVFAVAVVVMFSASTEAQTRPKQEPPQKWQQEPSSFFGIGLGRALKPSDFALCDTPSTIPYSNPDLKVCAKDYSNYSLVTLGGFPIAEFKSGFVALENYVASVVMVRADHRDHATVRSLLVERYGRPIKTKSKPVSNAMGAVFSNEVLEWDGEAVSITLEERSGQVGQTVVTVMHKPTASKAAEEKKKARAPDAAKM